MFHRKCEIYWYTFISLVTIVDIVASFLYTVWYYYVRGTPLAGFYVVPILFGVTIPSVICYFWALYPPTTAKFRSIIFFVEDEMYPDEDEDFKLMEACNSSAIRLLKGTSKTLGLLMLSFAMMTIAPTYEFIFKNNIQLIVPIIFPFTDFETKTGMNLNMANQFFIMLFGLIPNLLIEIGTCMLKNYVWTFTVVIGHSIDKISQSLEHPQGDEKTKIDLLYRNILIQIQDYDRFILEMSDVYYWKFFLQPFFLTFSVSLAVFLYLYGDYFSGLGLAFFTYIQLYILCDIGNDVDLSNKMLIDKLQQMPWYLMSPQKQRSYAHVLNRLQNGTILQMGPFGVLNFETFSDNLQFCDDVD
ncbi:uncharacterized protein LOC116343436 isoform X2 [Contarinia nasturtii]|uniref:uncharacterized protein LOC116343436 isoform X2 n=1 Tax=Contarinia nasturtii TaxID=265458 RepID=UPI0012D40C7A|nr:uncharacterized protein LOC116343436 isoform X2 [Contarinia nasturtii]